MSEKDIEIEDQETTEPKDIEVVPEEDTENGEENSLEEEPNGELDETEKLIKKLAKSDEKYLRVVAEYDNYRKRTAKERDSIYPKVIADTVARFLPVLDTFERSLEFDCSSDEFMKGMELIHQNFKDVLKDLGAEPIGEVGEPFDPELHNAVMHVEDPELGENVISAVMQKGYKIGDRVIRHAIVQTAN